MSIERWKADDAHKASAQDIENDLSSEIFEELDRLRRRVDGLDWPSDEAEDLYDPTVWPVPMEDAQGRRYEIEVMVTVTPIADVATQRAQVTRDRAAFRALQRKVVAARG